MNKNLIRFSLQEKILFTKRLGLLIRSGIPIASALAMLEGQAGTKSSKYLFGSMVKDVEQGMFLSASMGKFGNIFGDFIVNIINIGEVSGTLEENLNYLGIELKKKHDLERKLKSAMVYPAVIVLATFGITGLLTVYVFPKIVPIFLNFKVALPWTTRMLIFISSLIIHHWAFFILAMVLLTIILTLSYKITPIKVKVHSLLLKLPIMGELLRNYYLANSFRTLGLLLKSDSGIVRAVKITAGTCENLVFKAHLNNLAENVTKGLGIAGYIKNNPKVFPLLATQMISVGESTGSLSSSLLFLSELYENEVEDKTKNLTSILEPVLMITMGLMVGFIALSIITPIYAITQSIHP